MTADESRRVDDYLAHMLEATRLARTYTEELAKADFLEDKRTQQAVILNLITIGEAAFRICITSRCPYRRPLASNAWDAQSHDTRVFRHQP